MRRHTLDDVAQLARVSRTTVSMVLNGHARRYRLAPTTVEAVLDAARDLQFVPHAPARQLRMQKSNTVGVLLPDLSNSAHAQLAQALEQACRSQGWHMLLQTSNEQPKQEQTALQYLFSHQVEGLLIVPCDSNPESYAPWILRLPMIFVDRHVPGCQVSAVISDATTAVRDALRPALTRGLHDVLYLGGPALMSVSQDRLRGFEQALLDQGLNVTPNQIRQGAFSSASGQSMLLDWVQENKRWPEVIFTASITLLQGVLAALRHAGRVHVDIAPKLITFDDHVLLDNLSLPVDSLLQDTRALAQQALGLLGDLCNTGADAPWVSAGSVEGVPTRWIRRVVYG